MYLIDSDFLINFLKGEERAIKTINYFKNQAIYTSIICVGEILEGLLETKNKKKLVQFKEFLKTITIIAVDYPVIEKFAFVRKSLRKKGLLIDNFDLLIAAACLVYNLTLVTNNISHFKRIQGLKIFERD